MRRCSYRFNKRGSVLIFLTFILISIISAVIIFSADAKAKAEASYHRTITDIASRSLLAEYDIKLKEEYGIFAFRGNSKYIAEKIDFYIRYVRNNSETIFSLKNDEIYADSSEYSITNTEVFEKQIIDAVKYGFLNTKRASDDECGNILGNIGQTAKESSKASGRAFQAENLPSQKYRSKGLSINANGLTSDSLKDLIKKSGKEVMIDSYIFTVFKNYTSQICDKDTYYNYEVEYIVAGCESDISNLNKIKQYFITLRTSVNIAKIYADPVRVAQALAEAEALTPGPAAAATQLAIITAWAAEDAENEWKIVIMGGEVDGFSYSDYLAMFLIMQKREVKLLRMMDLMQLNLGISYYKNFIMSEHACGFKLSIILDGKMRRYEHCY